MAVEDMRHAQNLGGFKHRPREQREALGVVRIVTGRASVERLPVEVWRIIHEIKSNSGAGARGHHRAEAILVIERDGDAADHRLRIGKFGLTIARNVHAHLVSQSRQGLRQGADHVGQSAGFGKGNALGCRESDMHGV